MAMPLTDASAWWAITNTYMTITATIPTAAVPADTTTLWCDVTYPVQEVSYGTLWFVYGPDWVVELGSNFPVAGHVAIDVIVTNIGDFAGFALGAAESYRTGSTVKGSEGLGSLQPGDAFGPVGVTDDPITFAESKVEEIKNGWLAMFSMLGHCVHAIVAGEPPPRELGCPHC